jgi:hypothetical protein
LPTRISASVSPTAHRSVPQRADSCSYRQRSGLSNGRLARGVAYGHHRITDSLERVRASA